jgi:hypothetical protein
VLNDAVLNRFRPNDRPRLGLHTCPGADDSTFVGVLPRRLASLMRGAVS